MTTTTARSRTVILQGRRTAASFYGDSEFHIMHSLIEKAGWRHQDVIEPRIIIEHPEGVLSSEELNKAVVYYTITFEYKENRHPEISPSVRADPYLRQQLRDGKV